MQLHYVRHCILTLALIWNPVRGTLILKDQLVQQHFNETILIKKLIKWIQTSTKGKIIKKYGYDIKKIQSDLKITMLQKNP